MLTCHYHRPIKSMNMTLHRHHSDTELSLLVAYIVRTYHRIKSLQHTQKSYRNREQYHKTSEDCSQASYRCSSIRLNKISTLHTLLKITVHSNHKEAVHTACI